MEDEYKIFVGNENFVEIQRWAGKRPGNKMVDPYYLKHGMGQKCYFWEGRWILLNPGDMIYKRADGSVALEKGAVSV
jgi:hypothetical protein